MSEDKQLLPNETASGSEEPRFDKLSEVLPEVIESFRKIDPESRKRLLSTIATFFDIKADQGEAIPAPSGARTSYSEDRSLSPKEFLRQKQPRTDMERVACLAYYLTHYRDTPHFKTLDISKLNTEAAQTKFANAANSVNNAASHGYLTASTKGNKQLTLAGESFVDALPDREAAREAMANARPRRRRRQAATVKEDGKESAKAVGAKAHTV